MRILLLASSTLILTCAASGQDSANRTAKPPKDPRELLAAAAPSYDFYQASLRPWYLKGHYQLFDESGHPGEQGMYEYWSTEPGMYRSTWSRPGRMRTEWHSENGRTMSVASGGRMLSIESDLRDLLVSAVPDILKLKPGQAHIEKDELKVGKITFPCAKLDLQKQNDGRWPVIPGVRAGSYCFEGSEPLLRVQRVSNSEYIEFDHLRKTQGRIIAGEITWICNGRNILKFSLDELKEIDRDDPALKPTSEARISADDAPQPSAAQQGRLVKKSPPVYPPAAKAAHVSGTVLLDVLIGADGKVRDLYVLSSSSPLLTQAAKDSVGQWQYSPYMVDGEPQEVTTRVTVFFMLGG